MRGMIRTKEKCSICNKPFEHIQKLGLICPEHKTTPAKYYIDMSWQGQRIRIFSDKQGQPLDSYQRTLTLQSKIQHEIDNHYFDSTKYVKSDLIKFYFSNIVDIWINEKQREVEQKFIAYSYVKELIAYKEKYFVPFFKDKDIREARRYDIDDFKAWLPTHLSPKTIKNIFTALKNLFYTVLRKEIIEKMPSFPVISVPEFSNWKWINMETQVKILDCIPEEHKPLFIFLFLHGCRPGEARALKVKDIELATKTLKIRRTFSLEQLRETTKQKRQNTIPIHHEFFDYLCEMIKSSLPEAYVFINYRTGKPYNGETLRKIWHKALKKAGLEKSGLRLYDASRHSFASQLVNADVPLNVISKLLGHSTLKMTQRYAHENISTMQIAVKKLSLLKKEPISKLSPDRHQRVKSL